MHTRKKMKRPDKGLEQNMRDLNSRVSSFRSLKLDPQKHKMNVALKGAVTRVNLRDQQKLEFVKEINSVYKNYKIDLNDPVLKEVNFDGMKKDELHKMLLTNDKWIKNNIGLLHNLREHNQDAK